MMVIDSSDDMIQLFVFTFHCNAASNSYEGAVRAMSMWSVFVRLTGVHDSLQHTPTLLLLLLHPWMVVVNSREFDEVK